jgi:hypothetical protein
LWRVIPPFVILKVILLSSFQHDKGIIMALSSIDKVKTILGITESNPFYPILDDDEVEYALELASGNPLKAARYAGVWASAVISALPIKEMTDEVELWTKYPSEYRQTLNLLLDESKNIPAGLMPYFAGISCKEFWKQSSNPDNITSPLEKLVECNLKKQCGGC